MSTVAANGTKKDKSKSKARQWIYAKKPQGPLFNKRQWVGYSLLLFLIVAPFIRINGEPFLMFNIIERKFSIFGNLFYPQDLYIFVFGMLIALVCIVLFTAVYGRVWCGWTCPQTIFMELVFRRIEYLIEGDWMQQKRLNEGPNSMERYLKKTLKHLIFLTISFFISNIFLSYIIGVEALFKIMTDPVDQHLAGLASIIVFTLAFYGVFAFVREIVCTSICPYGRLQGVLLDDQSSTVAYDYRRGEPRGKYQKGAASDTQGDCVDCKLCVNVCPTGIDIRNGLQLECVSCTACIDACDAVMEKIGKPTKLIGFYTMGEIEGTVEKKNNTRAIAYSVILFLLVSVFGFMLFNRSEIDGRVLRAKGSTYQLLEDGTITNLYSLELINKSGKEMPFRLECEDPQLNIKLVNPIEKLSKDGHATLSFFLIIANEDVEAYKRNVKLTIYSGDRKVESLKTTFIAPTGMN